MPGLSLTFDLVSGKVSVTCWLLVSDLVGFGLKLAPSLARATSGKLGIALIVMGVCLVGGNGLLRPFKSLRGNAC